MRNDQEKQTNIDHEKSAYETFEEDFKNSIFGVLYLLLQDEESSMFWTITTIFIQFLQICTFPFHPNVPLPHPHIHPFTHYRSTKSGTPQPTPTSSQCSWSGFHWHTPSNDHHSRSTNTFFISYFAWCFSWYWIFFMCPITIRSRGSCSHGRRRCWDSSATYSWRWCFCPFWDFLYRSLTARKIIRGS